VVAKPTEEILDADLLTQVEAGVLNELFSAVTHTLCASAAKAESFGCLFVSQE
jgi:hypothetical protein